MHKAVMEPIKVRHICTCPPLKKCMNKLCDGWLESGTIYTPCGYSTMVLVGEDGKGRRYCTNPPPPDCPPDPYKKSKLPQWMVEIDFNHIIDQVKWGLDDHTEDGEERRNLLYMLDEVKRRAIELAKKSGKKGE